MNAPRGFIRRTSRLVAYTTCITLACYLLVQSDLYVTRHNRPILEIQSADLSRCCAQPGGDVCKRPTCIPCAFVDQDNDSPKEKAYLHETLGASALDVRQACAVESLARLNPDLSVELLMTSPFVDRSAATMQALGRYSNVHLTNVDLGHYFHNTPLQYWYFCTTWNYGPYAVSHLSDALRFLTLFKFGGYYFDLDIVHLKPVTSLKNFIVADVGSEFLAAGAFHVGYRHPVTLLSVEEFSSTYRKHDWGYNGPELMTRVLRKWCGVHDVASMASDTCAHFTVLPPETFYPVGWTDWKKYFAEAIQVPTWNDTTFGVHFWNKKSAHERIVKRSNQVYVHLARSQCPQVFSSAPDTF